VLPLPDSRVRVAGGTATVRADAPSLTATAGGKDPAARAGEIWRKLEEFTPPPLDDAIHAEPDDFVARRRELGD
jgi:trimethylamine:corrinoid methyltransferase-like protein